MPSIVIKEIDLTKGGGEAAGTDVVYVPGFMSLDDSAWGANEEEATKKKKDAAFSRTPILCSTIAQFERHFGTKPAAMAETVKFVSPGTDDIPAGSVVVASAVASNNETFCKKDDLEKSYIYAKELINQGVPVLYESMNSANPDDTNGLAVTITPASMYDNLCGDVYTLLKEKGEYNFKYITSGGYPTLEYYASSLKLEPVYTVANQLTDIVVNETNGIVDYLSNKMNGNVTLGEYEFKYTTEGWSSNFSFNETDDLTTVVFKGPEGVLKEGEEDNAKTYTLFSGLISQVPRVGDTVRFTISSKVTKSTTSYSIGDPKITTVTPVVTIDTKKYFSKKDFSHDSIDSAILAGYPQDTVIEALKTEDISFSTFGEYGLATKGYEGQAGDTITVTVKTVSDDEHGGIVSKMIDLAQYRGDCVAIIDHHNNPSRALVGSNSVYNTLKSLGTNNANSEYAAAFTPWIKVDCTTLAGKDITHTMPPSLGYLMALGKSNKTNANWLAIAGATRGQIPNLNANTPLNITGKLTNSIAENEYQNRDGVSINAITNINPFGYRIWGNRTLKNNSKEGNLTATSFLNIRNMVSDVKKVVYSACKRLMFEQNNDILWTNFKAEIEPTLNRMKTGAGISGYKIVKGTTTEKAKLVATIRLYPLYAVEDFDVTVTMEDEEITVS